MAVRATPWLHRPRPGGAASLVQIATEGKPARVAKPWEEDTTVTRVRGNLAIGELGCGKASFGGLWRLHSTPQPGFPEEEC